MWEANSKAEENTTITADSQPPPKSFETPIGGDFEPADTRDKQQDWPPPGQTPTRWEYRGMVWIGPYLKSKWHKRAAIALYFAALGAHLFEGYWVSATISRTMAGFSRLWLADVRWGSWLGAVLGTCTMVYLSFLSAGILFIGGVIFVIQSYAIVDLCLFTLIL